MGNVTFLGVEGSGKTVLTMALVNAFKAHEAEGWYLRPETRGAFRFLSQVPENVSGNSLPHQTTSLRQLQWSVVYQDEVQRTLDILDYPGEVYRLAFLDAKDDPDPDGFRERVVANKEEINALLSHLIDSNQVFVLFNLADAEDVAGNGANLDAVWVTNACLDYLHRLPSHPQITLLLTQIDRYIDFETQELSPKVFVEHHLPLIAHNFPKLDVCAVSAIGKAETAFGVSEILLRCLTDTPTVSVLLSNLQTTRKALDTTLQTAIQSLDYANVRMAKRAFTHYVAELDQASNCWFVKPRLSESSIFAYSEKQRMAISQLLTVLDNKSLLIVSNGWPTERLEALKTMKLLITKDFARSEEEDGCDKWRGDVLKTLQRIKTELTELAHARMTQQKIAMAGIIICALAWGIILFVA